MTHQDPSDLFATPDPPARRPDPVPAPAPAPPAGPPPYGAPSPAARPALPGPYLPPAPTSPGATPGVAPVPSPSAPPSSADGARRDRPAAARARLGGGRVAGILVLALLVGLVGGFAGDRVADATSDDSPVVQLPAARGETGASGFDRAEGTVAATAAEVLPSVVSFEVTGGDGSASSGSGFVLRSDGYIVTNDHVVAGGARGGDVVVVLADGSEHEAEVVGRTSDYDLAVVRIDVEDLTPLVLGDSDDVVVGDEVLAVGAPLGLDSTVTSGIVSALHRPVQAGDQATTAFIDAIQTDAAINPGNSGGPLVNAAGEVIGINSAIAQPPGAMQATGSIGLGFAIPANQVRTTAEQLIASGEATYPVIGVLLDTSYTGEGVKVAEEPQDGNAPVTDGGPADLAGIRAGDVILAIDGRPVSQSDELIVAIRAAQAGDAVNLTVRTGEDERDVRVVLQERSSE
ncbi:trypsin-like peptidase domain-containing protein [Isoptericola halotolerans]|uniref:S1C family serine protease n=1 Tax=Isoptericola halotolerans TaxID=300560 RepID=UPI00388E4653